MSGSDKRVEPFPIGTIVYWATDTPESWKLTTTPGEMRIVSARWLDGEPSPYAKRFGGDEGVGIVRGWLYEVTYDPDVTDYYDPARSVVFGTDSPIMLVHQRWLR